MKTILNPTEEQLERLMNLIAFDADWDEESIGDRFCFGFGSQNNPYVGKDGYPTDFFCSNDVNKFIDFCKTKHPEVWNVVGRYADFQDEGDYVGCPFIFTRLEEGSDKEFFRAFCEYTYGDIALLRVICEEISTNYNNLIRDCDEICDGDENFWAESLAAYDSLDEYKKNMDILFKDVEFPN